jgi:hypothetical protein
MAGGKKKGKVLSPKPPRSHRYYFVENVKLLRDSKASASCKFAGNLLRKLGTVSRLVVVAHKTRLIKTTESLRTPMSTKFVPLDASRMAFSKERD